MRLSAKSPLNPGQIFKFDVGHSSPENSETIHVRASLNNEQIWEDDCADPPCQQMFVFIPDHAAGGVLTLHARSSSGKETSLELTVNSPSPGTLSAR